MIDIKINNPSDEIMQRTTYSTYYGRNRLKGGISLKHTGYIVIYKLWTGLCV